MRLEYFVLLLTCLSAVVSRCLADEQNGQVPQEKNPAANGNQNADRRPEDQSVSSAHAQPNQKQHQQHQQKSTTGNDQKIESHDTVEIEQPVDKDVKQVVADDHNNQAKEGQAVDLNGSGAGAGAGPGAGDKLASTEPSLVVPQDDKGPPQSVEVHTPVTEETKADDRKQDVVVNEQRSLHHQDLSGEEAESHTGEKEPHFQDTTTTPDVAKADTTVPHFPDAVVTSVTVDHLDEKPQEEGVQMAPYAGSPGVAPLPTTITPSESAVPVVPDKQPQVPLAKDQQSQDDAKQPADQSSELPIKSDDSQPLAVGSGGLAVEDVPGLEEELTKDFQTFGEWRKKVLEEELEKEIEKEKQMAKDGSGGETQTEAPVNSQKLRVNYASEKCGAKIVACNPEMENGNFMLTSNKDQYMINPCSSKKWFVVELCEPISAKTVELASMELFSSQPRSFSLSLADRYPPKEWLTAGTFEMTADKVPQPFSLNIKSPYVKFVRIDMLDHYGNEHFCPVTLLRIFGLPMEDDDGDDDHVHHEPESDGDDANSETLFARTKATVVNLVKKVLYKDEKQEQEKGVAEAAKEMHGNFSGEEALPCDPDLENIRLPEKTVEGTQVTVQYPQPTMDVMRESSSSAAPSEIPMVTKLDDGEQLETEERARDASGGGQNFVILLESGRSEGWERALHFCHPKTNTSELSCSFNPLCLYAETILGTPPPISRPRLMLDSPSVSMTESLTSSVLDELQPSFTSSMYSEQISETSSTAKAKESTINDISVQPSSDSTKEHTPALSSEATTQIPAQIPTKNIPSSSSETPVKTAESSKAAVSEERGSAVQESSQTSDKTDSVKLSVVRKETLKTRTGSEMVETDPGVPATTATGVDGGDLTSTQAADSNTAPSEATSEQDKAPVDTTAEILEPSIQLDTTSVVSPTLTRPTPVLEMAGASVAGRGSKGEVVETSMPSLSPSPTSETADAALGQQESAAYPEIIQPTFKSNQPVLKSETPEPAGETTTTSGESKPAPKQEEAAAVQNTTETSTKKNATDDKEADLKLVRVPLTLSAKRETALMRLTNRIKALELNVSLSSRFLEELSTRFKKQNEEMMKMLNKTMKKLNVTATVSQQQAALQEMRIDRLETRLDNLTVVVQRLADRFDTFAEQMSDRQMIFTTLNLSLVVLALYLFYRGCQSKPLHPDVQFLLDTMPSRPPPCSPFPRRNSDVAPLVHHDLDLASNAAMKKGGSVANLANPAGVQALILEDKPEMGPKKKKRKKNKPHKASSVDIENIGETDSDPGFRVSNSDNVIGAGGTEKFGHRRCGSATSFPFTGAVSSLVPPAKLDNDKEVQFSLGGKKLFTHRDEPFAKSYSEIDSSPPVSLPYSISSHSSCSAPLSSCVITAKPPLPRGQRSKSLTTPPSTPLEVRGTTDTFDGGGGGGGGGGCSTTVTAKADQFSNPTQSTFRSANSHNSQEHYSDTPATGFILFPKPKKAMPYVSAFVNGEKETKGADSEHSFLPQRKGSFRGGGSCEEGKGGGGKAKPCRKPSRSHTFEKA